MKITRIHNKIGFKEFSEENFLELEIVTRYGISAKEYGKYCVSWFGALVIDGSVLTTCVGDGDTEISAVKDYIDKIKGKFIKINSSDYSTYTQVSVPQGLFFDFEDGELN